MMRSPSSWFGAVALLGCAQSSDVQVDPLVAAADGYDEGFRQATQTDIDGDAVEA